MGVITKEKKLVIIAETKTIHFDFSKDASNSLKHEIDFIIKHNEVLIEHKVKNEVS